MSIKLFYKNNTPLFWAIVLFIAVVILWFLAGSFWFINEEYSSNDFRTDIKEIASLAYIVITLWLVLVTRKVAEVSINAQKALFKPEIECKLLVHDVKPTKDLVGGNYKSLQIRNTREGGYIDGLTGASIFLLISNKNGGGKAKNITIDAKFELRKPDLNNLERRDHIEFLADGDAVALFITNIERPALTYTLDLIHCKIEFTDPYSEASGESLNLMEFNDAKELMTIGSQVSTLTMRSGIKIN